MHSKIKQTNAHTYSQATKQTMFQPIATCQIDRETNIKIQICLMHAHYLNSVNPGSFNIKQAVHSEQSSYHNHTGTPTLKRYSQFK